MIRSFKDGASLNIHTWEHVVKEGAHLTQAMVLSEIKINPRKCLFADCKGALDNDGNCWFVETHILPLILEISNNRPCLFANVATA